MLKFAVVGVGSMGKNHARVYSQLSGAQLVAVCDADKATADAVAKEYGCKAYYGIGALLSAEELDGISIVVPTFLHEKTAMPFLEKGVACLIEKPLAFDEAEAGRIIKAAKKRNTLVLVGYLERFNPAVQAAKDFIESEKLGRIISMMFRRVGVLPSRIKDVNVIQDAGSHDLDLMHYLNPGRGIRYFSATAGSAFIEGRYDYAHMLFSLQDNVSVFIESNWATPTKLREMSIVGDKGMLVANLAQQEVTYYPSMVEKHGGSVKITPLEAVKLEVVKAEPLKLELEHFVDCISGKAKPRITLEDALFPVRTANDVTNSLMKRYSIKKALRRVGIPDSITNKLIRQR